MWSRSICLSLSDLFHLDNALKVHLCCCQWQDFTLSEWNNEWIIFHYVCVCVCVYIYIIYIFPSGASSKEPTCQCRRHRRGRFDTEWKDPLEEDMTTHSSIFAWIIPWAEKSGRLQSMGPQSWTWLKQLSMHIFISYTHTHTHTHTHIYISHIFFIHLSTGGYLVVPISLLL